MPIGKKSCIRESFPVCERARCSEELAPPCRQEEICSVFINGSTQHLFWSDSSGGDNVEHVKVLPRPEVILTHESDLDGLVSGLLLQRLTQHLFGTATPLEAFHYNNWRLREPREKSGWVCDLSFEARLDKPDWVVIDHHATEAKPKNALFIHDLGKSAGLLCYELCKEHGLGSPELDRLVHLNNVADLFLEDDPDFVLANDYANLVKTYQFWNLHALIEGQLERLLEPSVAGGHGGQAADRRPDGPGVEQGQRPGNQPHCRLC